MRVRQDVAGALVLVVLAVTVGCSSASGAAFAESFARGLSSAARPARVPKIMVFGGCERHASDSMFNEYSTFGSPYGEASISNHYGAYGSRYSEYSACNPYATDPPVIVDREGRFYGRLTLNHTRGDAIDDTRLVDWLAAVCEDA